MKKKQNKKSILVICAHSDDQIIGPGGTLAKYAEEGKDIYTVIFSYGESSHLWYKKKIAAKTRVKEAQEADKIIGGKGIIFLGIPEAKFMEKKNKIIKTLKKIIKEKKPIKIFTHSINDPHINHREVYNIVKEACNRCSIYSFDVWNLVNIFKRNEPKMYVDISKTFDKKIKALKCFPSQKIQMQIPLTWSVYLRAFLNGLNAKCRFAERFDKVK